MNEENTNMAEPRKIVRCVQDARELARKIKPGNRITFISHIVMKQSDGNKHRYKTITDKAVKAYPGFVYTEKRHCVQYVDIISVGY